LIHKITASNGFKFDKRFMNGDSSDIEVLGTYKIADMFRGDLTVDVRFEGGTGMIGVVTTPGTLDLVLSVRIFGNASTGNVRLVLMTESLL
jgi:hypothetical protein